MKEFENYILNDLLTAIDNRIFFLNFPKYKFISTF